MLKTIKQKRFICKTLAHYGIIAYLCTRKQETNGAIAQLVEQRTENPCVPGSIPGGTTPPFISPVRASGRVFFLHEHKRHPEQQPQRKAQEQQAASKGLPAGKTQMFYWQGIFFEKSCTQLKKKQYLCTRFQGNGM